MDDKKNIDILPAVTHRCCPSCGYLVTQLMVDLSRYNYNCHNCGKHKLSKFQPLNMSDTIVAGGGR